MIACPVSKEFQDLVDFAKQQGMGVNAENMAYMAYMMINQDLELGQEPVIPTNDEFLAIMYQIGEFTMDGPGREPYVAEVSFTKSSTGYIKPGVQELFDSNPELANAVYEALGFTLYELPIIDTENIISFEGTKGAAQYDRKNNQIKVNRKFLKQKFEEKAWTKPRKLIETLHGETIESYAQALPENQFKTYKEWEQFVINHEYQHSLYSRQDFDKEFPNKTKGDYESEINRRALNQITPQQKQQALQLYSQYLDTIFPDSKVKDIVYHGTNATIEFFDKSRIGSNTLNYGFYGKGFYFNETKNDLINWWKTLYKKEPNIVTAIINTKNPYKEASNVIEEKTKLGNKQETELFTDNLLQENYDSVLPQIPKEEGSNEFVVFEPEQIHILGSKQDIEGFKEFVEEAPITEEPIGEPTQPQPGDTNYYQDIENAFPWYKLVRNPISLDSDTFPNEKAKTVVYALAEKLAVNTGVPVEFITVEEAIAITKGVNNWSGQPAFYFGETVYIIPELATAESVLHEFAHPIIRSIYLNNRPLFDKLVQDLKASKKGKEIFEAARNTYPTADENDPIIPEEALVIALTESQVETEDSAFNKFISNLLYAIKQLLRKVFQGEKIKVENLNGNTTLKELGDMIMTESFQIDTKGISREDIAAFQTSVDDYITQYSKLKDTSIERLVNSMYDMMKNHVRIISKEGKYAEMAKIISNVYNDNDLQRIKSILAPFQTMENFSRNEMKKVEDTLKFAQNRVNGFVESLLTLDHILNKVTLSITELTKDLNVKENTAKVMYVNNILGSWEEYLNTVQAVILEEVSSGNINIDNPAIKLVNELKGKITGAQNISNKVYFEGGKEAIFDSIEPMMENIDKKYKDTLEYLRKRGASKERIAQHQADYYGLSGRQLDEYLNLLAKIEKNEPLSSLEKSNYEKLKMISYKEGAYLNKEKIDYLMSGRLGDGHAMNSFLEGYMNNQDPIVFGLATYVKNNITDAYTRAQKLGNEFLMNIQPILKRAGYNQSNPASFFKQLTFRDKKGGFDENGQYQTEEVISYIGPWKDYRADVMQMDHAIRVATEEAMTSGNYDEVFRLKQDRERFREKYMHRDYTDAYYKRFDVFRKGPNDEIGAKAETLRSELLARIQNATNGIQRSQRYNYNEEDKNEIKVLWEEWRELHSDYDVLGQPKSDEDRAIAARLREFRDVSKDLYIINPINGFFEESLKKYEEYLINHFGYKKGDPGFINRRNAWIAENTRVKLRDSWYKKTDQIWSEINAIMAKVPKNEPVLKQINKYKEELNDLLKKNKDEDNQPNARQMSEEVRARIKELQNLIDELNEQLEGASGLTKIERQIVREYYEAMNEGAYMSIEDIDRALTLIAKRKSQGLSKEDKKRLEELYAELNEISASTPTQYYYDEINNILHNQVGLMKEIFGMYEVNASNFDVVLTPEFYNKIVKTDPSAKEWFDKNHRQKEYFEKGEPVLKYERIKAFSVTKPIDSNYYEKFTFINTDGVEEILQGMPTMEYYERRVKDEYVTKPITVAEAIEMGNVELANWDDKTGWLPRLDAEDGKYRNEKYFEMKQNKPLFAALQVMTKWHFKFQEGNTTTGRLGFDIPRYRKAAADSRLEYVTGEGKPENPISKWWRRVRSMFVASPDDYDQGYNIDDQVMLMEGELYNDENAGIPITGLSKLPADDVSLDLTFSMLKYMISGQKQQKLIEMNPMVRALQTALKAPENAIKSMKNISKDTHKNRGWISLNIEKLKSGKSEERSTRVKAIDNFIEREFEGKNNKGLFGNPQDYVTVTKIADNLIKLSAFGYFALDIGSAIRNNMSARIQSLQEAVGGRYYNTRDYAKGSAWANKTVMDISLNLYKFGPKSLQVQMTEIFDVAANRFETKFADHGSRSVTRDALNDLSWMTSIRQLGEMSTAFSVFGAMMYNEKNVTQTIGGVTKKIAYMDAWEVVNGQIQLKEGVDPEWGTEGKKFKSFKNRVQGVINNISGAYAKFDYAEADRYLAWRWLTTFKRFFIRMFMNRYQFRGNIKNPRYRYDAALQDTVMGFHVEAFRALFRGIKSRGEYLQTLAPSEKVALLKLTTDFAYIILFGILSSWVFGYDEDDEDKYEKIRARSGPLPFFGVAEGEEQFKLKGWLANHAMLLTFQLRNETLQFMPWTGAGIKNYLGMLQFESVSTKNTTDNYKKIGAALMRHIGNATFGLDDTKAYWDQREGPYSWMQKDGSKAVAYTLRSLGMTGKGIDPGTATINEIKITSW